MIEKPVGLSGSRSSMRKRFLSTWEFISKNFLRNSRRKACFNTARTAISSAAIFHFIERLQVPFPFLPFFVVQIPNFFELYVHCLDYNWAF
jgi:hypothetical protein